MTDASACITLQLTNPGGRDLTVHSVQYELSHGELLYPLVSSVWTGSLDLPAKGENRLPLFIEFDDEPIELDSSLLHLNGMMEFKDHTGFLGLSSMDLTGTSFQLEVEASRSDQ